MPPKEPELGEVIARRTINGGWSFTDAIPEGAKAPPMVGRQFVPHSSQR